MLVTDSAYKARAKIPPSQNWQYKFRLPTEQEWIRAASGNLDHSEHPFGYLSFKGPTSLTGDAKKYYKKVTVAVDYKVFKNDLKIFAKRQEEIIFSVIKRFKNYFQYGDYAPAHIL